MSSTDPSIAHNNTLTDVANKYSGVTFAPPEPAKAPAPVAAPEAPAVTEQNTSEATPAPEPTGVGTQAEPAPQAAPQSTPAAKPERLQRSLEIQRRAEAAARRARTEASKLKQPAPQPKEEPKSAPGGSEGDAQVSAIRAQLEQEIRLAKTDPLSFMRQQGLTGAQIAEFVKQGADPVARSVDLLRQDAARAIVEVEKRVRAEYDQKFNALAGEIVQDRENRAQTNFFTFVEEAKAQNPDAFKAIGSGLLYSEGELWNKANELLANRPDLQKDFDEDKLLEAVETEARKDPRWSKLEPLLTKETPQQKPNAAPKPEKSNVSAKVETPPARTEEPQRQAATRERDPQTGQFVQQRRSPLEDHTKHVDTVVNRVLGRPFGR